MSICYRKHITPFPSRLYSRTWQRADNAYWLVRYNYNIKSVLLMQIEQI